MKSSIRYVLTLSLLIPVVGCSTSEAQPQSRTYATSQPAAFSQQQLDSLLAPVALYPDSVLSHMLIASTYPLEVVEADRWARNSRLTGDDAVNAVENKNWDPSVKALVAFPDVLKRMSEDLDWTQQVGDAFLEDEGRVMDTIQNLRDKAYAAGNLRDTEHARVVRENRVIMIEPAVERVVYVPVYDTRVVYGPWWWVDYPPVYWHRYSNQVYLSGSFYWGPRVYIGPRFHFSSCHWRDRRVVVIDHHHHDYYHHRHAYTGRHLAHYKGARHWHHNPDHRRGVAYYNDSVRNRYNSNREPRRNSWDDRQNARDRAGVYSKNPDRERQASRFDNRDSRNSDNREARGINRGNDSRNAHEKNNQPSTERNRQQVFENRSDAVRARLAERQNNRDSANRNPTENAAQNNRWNNRPNNQADNQQNNRRIETRQDQQTNREPNRFSRGDDNNQNTPRQIIRNNNESNNNRFEQRQQREVRTEQRAEPRMERRIEQRSEPRIERRMEQRAEPRMERRSEPRMERHNESRMEARRGSDEGGRRVVRE